MNKLGMQFPAPSPAEKEKHYTAHLYTVHVYVYIYIIIYIYDCICICSRFDRIYFWPKFGLNRLQIVFFFAPRPFWIAQVMIPDPSMGVNCLMGDHVHSTLELVN